MLKSSDLKSMINAPQGAARARPNAWLRVSGPDAPTFLQGQCTQDLRPLQAGQCAEALWLNTKGRILGESLVLKENAERWWLWSAHTDGESLRARLEDFIIADDVTVTPEERMWDQVTLAGATAERWLAASLGGTPAPAPGCWAALGGGYIFAGRRGQGHIWDWLRPTSIAGASSAVPVLPPPAELGELSAIALHRARLATGVPAIPGEFGPQDLPQEAGLENVAISFNKGCYLGQEVMARLHAMGQVRRRLLRVGGVGPAPAVNVELRQNDKRIGELRAVVDDGRGGWLGLAILNLLGLASGASITSADNHAVHILDPLPA